MKSLKNILSALLVFGVITGASAQEKDTLTAKKDTAASSKPKNTAKKPEKIKPYKELITSKAVSDHGCACSS